MATQDEPPRTIAPRGRGPGPEGATLVVLAGPRRGSVLALGDTTTLGRDPGSDVVLASPSASARHARIAREGTGHVLEDLGSTNGTRVGGKSLRGGERRTLRHGDVIEVGDEALLFSDPPAPPGTLGPLVVDRRRVAGEVDDLLEDLGPR
jgi:pSer/pThr/pTyr-binding forkhead associated (FHA) protein